MADAARKSRLSRSAEFDRVYRHGRSAQDRHLVLYRFDRPEDIAGQADGALESRIGITVSRRIGSAVERNRLKRQLREALQSSSALERGADYVVIARPGLAQSIEREGFSWLSALVDTLAGKLTPTTR